LFTSAVWELHAGSAHREDMKRLAPLVVALSLATGCAHSQQGSHSARTVAVTAAVIAGVVLATMFAPCPQCDNSVVTTDTGARR
jgi:hypothetical protein